ncbi:unnamed protein product [Camellia sinensis]
MTSRRLGGPIVDTVVMNRPFGTRKKGADMDFLFETLKGKNLKNVGTFGKTTKGFENLAPEKKQKTTSQKLLRVTF